MGKKQTVKILGRFIVADPKVCHGQPTLRGTRIAVADVLEQVARGLDREIIIEEWHGRITHEAIAEAAHLAAQALLRHADDFVVAKSHDSVVTTENLSVSNSTFTDMPIYR